MYTEIIVPFPGYYQTYHMYLIPEEAEELLDENCSRQYGGIQSCQEAYRDSCAIAYINKIIELALIPLPLQFLKIYKGQGFYRQELLVLARILTSSLDRVFLAAVNTGRLEDITKKVFQDEGLIRYWGHPGTWNPLQLACLIEALTN